MNKSAIKSFAIWARTKLINEITYKSGLIGITDKGISHPLDSSTDNIQHFNIGTEKPYEIKDREIKQRDAYIKRIKEKALKWVTLMGSKEPITPPLFQMRKNSKKWQKQKLKN